jgi:hypothetical protein
MSGSDSTTSLAMIRYRINAVGKDGHFTGPPKEVECADESEIVAIAMQIKNGGLPALCHPAIGPTGCQTALQMKRQI